MAEKITVQLEVDAATGIATIKKFGEESQQAIEKVKKGTEEAKGPLASFREGWVSLATKITAATAVIYTVTRSLSSFIKEAAEAQAIENRLRYALETTGYSWKDAKSAVDQFANAVQKMTRYSDEQARQALTDMMMYTQDFSKAQMGAKLAMDMSIRIGHDLGSTTRLIGMAMSGNVEMLGRYIPELRNLEGRLGENATMADKAAFALKILSEKFGGTAQEDVKTFTGKVAQFKNAWSDTKEAIGNLLLGPAAAILTWLKAGAEGTKAFAEELGNLKNALLKGQKEELGLQIRRLQARRETLLRGPSGGIFQLFGYEREEAVRQLTTEIELKKKELEALGESKVKRLAAQTKPDIFFEKDKKMETEEVIRKAKVQEYDKMINDYKGYLTKIQELAEKYGPVKDLEDMKSEYLRLLKKAEDEKMKLLTKEEIAILKVRQNIQAQFIISNIQGAEENLRITKENQEKLLESQGINIDEQLGMIHDFGRTQSDIAIKAAEENLRIKKENYEKLIESQGINTDKQLEIMHIGSLAEAQEAIKKAEERLKIEKENAEKLLESQGINVDKQLNILYEADKTTAERMIKAAEERLKIEKENQEKMLESQGIFVEKRLDLWFKMSEEESKERIKHWEDLRKHELKQMEILGAPGIKYLESFAEEPPTMEELAAYDKRVYEANKKLQESLKTTLDLFGTMKDSIADVFEALVLGTRKSSDAFKGLGTAILKNVVGAFMEMMKKKITTVDKPLTENFTITIPKIVDQGISAMGKGLEWVWGQISSLWQGYYKPGTTTPSGQAVTKVEGGGISGISGLGGNLGAGGIGLGIGGLMGSATGRGGIRTLLGGAGGGILGGIGGAVLGSSLTGGFTTIAGMTTAAAATGAMLGSVLPIVGTIIGGLIGALAGGLLGGGKKGQRRRDIAAMAYAQAKRDIEALGKMGFEIPGAFPSAEWKEKGGLLGILHPIRDRERLLKVAQDISGKITSTISEALTAGLKAGASAITFARTLRESIYENALQGLIDAFTQASTLTKALTPLYQAIYEMTANAMEKGFSPEAYKRVVMEKWGAVEPMIASMAPMITILGDLMKEMKKGITGGAGMGRVTIPSFQRGGEMPWTGLALVHKGEKISPTGTSPINIYLNANISNEMDLNSVARKLGRLIDWERRRPQVHG